MEPVEKHDLNTFHMIPMIPLLREGIRLLLFTAPQQNYESVSINGIAKPLGNCTVNFDLYFLMYGYSAIV